MASLYNVLIKKDTSIYLKIAKELFRKGEITINNFKIKPHEKAYTMYNMNPKSSDYKNVQIPEVDWIVLATTRSREAFLFNKLVYKGIEKSNMDMITAVNWPEMMQQMTKSIANFSTVEFFGLNKFLIQQKKRPLGGRVYDYFSDSDLEKLIEIDKSHKLGHTNLMMIDADMIDNKSSYNSLVDIGNDSHWVVYEGGLQFYDKNGKVTSVLDDVESLTFRIFTWGYNPVDYKNEKGKPIWDKNSVFLLGNNRISVKSFKSNYYGYIEVY
ncbi:hypothetical protein [Flavobacterium covae]|uniref:hypothetical protein n=1 Tax=Flavobacterium covae TaxID=2906076 RepID=UPI0035E42D30